jgi:hypothetical protein
MLRYCRVSKGFAATIASADLNLSMTGHVIERVASFKYLGVTMDEKLTWSQHSRAKSTALKRSLGAVKSTFGKNCDQEILLLILRQQLFPAFSYGLAATYPQFNKDRTVLERAQRFSLRTVSRDFHSPYSDILRSCNFLPVSYTAASYRMRLIFVYHHDLRYWPANLFSLQRDLPVRRAARLVRNEAQYELPAVGGIIKPNVTALRQSIRLWNTLPDTVIQLEKKAFYNFLKVKENLESIVENFPLYNVN